jgi:cysteinyl-tRNA synthetase, unknown class
MTESPLFWGVVIFIAVLAYLMGRKAGSQGANPPAAEKAPMQPMPSAGGHPPAVVPTVARAGARGAAPQASHRTPDGRAELGKVQSWGYQLQNLDLKRAAASPFDLIVIDYTKDGSEETRLTPAEVTALKRKPDGSRRVVLAYVSIGEAESYRPYWDASWKKNKPLWLLKENPEWPENYSVCFWDPGWQRLMCGRDEAYLDRIQAQGFDGLYLDKCDVYEDLQAHEKRIAASRPDIEGDMVAFVQSISRNLKARDPNFLIVMQNAESLLAHGELLAAIDGVAKEELVYGVEGPEKKNGADEVEFSRTCLDRARKAGKAVFVVEYLNARDKIAKAAEAVSGFGYILYIAPKDRELKRLNYDVLEA